MSTISGVSSAGGAWSNMSAMRSQMQARMFAKVDTDSSGGVDKTELQGLLDDVGKKTGVNNSSSTDELFSKMDSDSDGSLSTDELSQGMKDIMPQPPSTMDFAQARSADGADDLFGKVDTDDDGSVSQEEMKSLMDLMDQMAAGNGTDGSASSSTSSSSSSDKFSQLDTDSDGSLSKVEFEAGRPQGGNGPQAAGGMPPPGGAGGGSASSSSSTYDPLDTNEDGVVSVQERMAASSSTDALESLFKSIDGDGDGQISASESDAFVQQLTEQVESLSASAQGTDSSSGGDAQAKSTQDSFDLARLARRAYDQIASGWAQQAKGSTLSAVA